MIQFTVYDGLTGQIIRSGEAQASTLQMQASGENEAITFGAYPADTHFIKNGVPFLRPSLPNVSVTGNALRFDAELPRDTIARVSSRFFEGEVPVTSQEIAFTLPSPAVVEIEAPWPYRSATFELTGEDVKEPADDAQLIEPDLDLTLAYFLRAVTERGDQLADEMLGNPDAHTLQRWKLKRSIRDRYLAGTNTPSDDAAMTEAVRYSGLTVQEELAAIGAAVAFEDWVIMRADGIRRETIRRMTEADSYQGILAAVAWAEAESETAVAEAQANLAA